MRDFLRHYFLPHHTNGHRPKILHHQSLSFLIVILLMVAFIIPPVRHEYPSVLGITANVSINDLLILTNQKRAEAGLSPVVLNSALSKAAEEKAQYMIEKNFWAHVAPDGTTPWYFIKNSGYEYLYAGENLARGYNSAPDVMAAWMASPSHRENILSPHYKDIGFAVKSGTLTGADTVLIVEEFGSKYQDKETATVRTDEPLAQNYIPTPSLQPIAKSSSEVNHPRPTSTIAVAAAVSKPLIDSKSTTRNLSIFILAVFIFIFVVDGIFIERKKIARVVAHNLDHIIFLAVLLIAVIIIGGGVIL